MTDKPILFSAPMIRALLDGRKTQTRRVAKFVRQGQGDLWNAGNAHGGLIACDESEIRSWAADYAPYAPGDRLWVREAWKPHSLYDQMKPRDMPVSKVFYLADIGYSPSGSRGRPGMFMPRWASRLTLIVTDVRVQRLQEISEKDAIAEGLEYRMDWMPQYRAREGLPWRSEFPRDAFADLWDDVNGPEAWEKSPWVAAYTFTVHRCNVDALANPEPQG